MLALFRGLAGIIWLMKTAVSSAPEKTIPEGFSVEELVEELTQKDDIIDKKSHVIREQKKRIALLEEYLRLERNRRFGASSEKNPAQEELDIIPAQVRVLEYLQE